MKDLRAQSRANAASRLKSMGGSRSAHGARGYADGGSVMDGMGGMGMARAKPASKGKKGAATNVNVIIMPKDGQPSQPPMPPMPPPGGPGAGPMPPPAPPPGPPPSMGGGLPPMPMRKFGGRVKGAETKKAVMTDRMDKTADKKMIKKAMGAHDQQMHGGKKTKLKLKRGGRAKMKGC